MSNDSIVSIAYYDGERYLPENSNKIPQYITTDFTKIKDITIEINTASAPGPWKGARWDFLLLTKLDNRVDTLYLNEKVIGPPHASGWFFKFKKEGFIERYFKKKK